MTDGEENALAKSNNTIFPQNNKDKQTEVRNLFKKLSRWREESQREFSNIMNSLSSSTNELSKEVGDLQEKLLATTKEKNDLHDLVDILSGEIRQLTEELNRKVTQEEGCPETEAIDMKGGKFNTKEYQEGIEGQQKDPLNSNSHLNDSIFEGFIENDEHGEASHEVTKDNIDEGQEQEGAMENNISPKEEVFLEDYVCPVCKLVFSMSEHLKIHMNNVHSKFVESGAGVVENKELQGISVHSRTSNVLENQDMDTLRNSKLHNEIFIQTRDEKGKCDKLTFETFLETSVNGNKNVVERPIRNQVCKECGYATKQKTELRRHIKEVHEKKRNHFCRECNYASTRKQHLNDHVKAVHEKNRNHVCGECAYASSERGNLNRHIKMVHQNIRNHVCGMCGYAAAVKHDLTRHISTVHKTEENKSVFDQIY